MPSAPRRRPSLKTTYRAASTAETTPAADDVAADDVATKAATATEVAATMATATKAPPVATAKRPESKFTVLLSPEDAVTFDELAARMRRMLGGRRVAKGELVRALVALAADDAALREQLVRELEAKAR